MRLVVFDALQESHLGHSIARAWRQLGHEALETGPLTSGLTLPQQPTVLRRLDTMLEQTIAARPDAVLVMRLASLDPARIDRLAKAGIVTLLFSGDDPLLYRLLAADLVDRYDLVLHTGGEQVLAFYDTKGHRPGLHFPFWADEEDFPYIYDWDFAQDRVLFFGNAFGPAKVGRYRTIAALRPYCRILGRVDGDPDRLWDGEVERPELATAQASSYRMALNIPQVFADHAGSVLDFPELRGFSHFDLPSRVVQYAAWGLPIVGMQIASEHFPEQLAFSSVADLRAALPRLLGDRKRLLEQSLSASRRFQSSFSALARARLIEALLNGQISVDSLSFRSRSYTYAEFG